MDVEQLIVNMHNDLSKKVDDGFNRVTGSMANHEVLDTDRFGKINTAINELQNTRTTLRWFVTVVIVALVGGVVEHFINHRVPDPSTPVRAEQQHFQAR